MRILLIASLLMVPLQPAVVRAQGQSPSQRSPELAAALMIRSQDIADKLVVLNSRFLPPAGKGPYVEHMPSDLAASMGHALNARVAAHSAVKLCERGTYACRFESAEAIVSVGKATVHDDSASVLVRVEIDHQPGRVKGQSTREYLVDLQRAQSGWVARKATLLWVGR